MSPLLSTLASFEKEGMGKGGTNSVKEKTLTPQGCLQDAHGIRIGPEVSVARKLGKVTTEDTGSTPERGSLPKPKRKRIRAKKTAATSVKEKKNPVSIWGQ